MKIHNVIKRGVAVQLLLIPVLTAYSQDYLRGDPPHVAIRKIQKRHADFKRNEMVEESSPVTFLGVHTTMLDPTVSAQLGLPPGMGLTTRYVVPESPAEEAGLQAHDILRKLDDQILIHPYQLRVLIRTRNEGDKVVFTVLRAGEEINLQAELVMREPATYRRRGDFGLWYEAPDTQGSHGVMRAIPVPDSPTDYTYFDHDIRLFSNDPDEFEKKIGSIARHSLNEAVEEIRRVEDRLEGRKTIIKMRNKNILFKDKDGVITLTTKDGNRHLIAKDTEGNEVFNGPINSPEERNQLPETIRRKLSELEGTGDIDLSTEPGEIRIIGPHSRGDVI